MAVGLDVVATLKASVSWTAVKTVQGSEGKFSEVDAKTVTFTTGKGSGNIDVLFKVEDATLAEGASTTYDLSGTLTDVFGEAAVFVFLKGLFIDNTSDTQSSQTEADIIVGDSGANTTAVDLFSTKTSTHKILAGGFFFIASKVGIPVANTTADILTLKQSGSGIARYTMVLVGEIA